MIRILVALFVLAFTSQTYAQDISLKIDEIPAGSWYYSTGSDGPSFQVFRGKRGKDYVIDLIPGEDVNGPRAFRAFLDAQGNDKKKVYADGRVVTYTPHSCRRVVGQCTFVETGKRDDGTTYRTKMIRVNTPKGGGFDARQVVVAQGGTQQEIWSASINALDEKGMPIETRQKKLASGNKTFRYKKVRASWD